MHVRTRGVYRGGEGVIWRLIQEAWARLHAQTRDPLPRALPEGISLVDRRAHAVQAHGLRGAWKVGRRPWSKTTGITLHQTACLLGERAARWDSVGAHVGITRGGQIIWLHDFDRVVAHGNGWNAQCVGIEIDGLFAGVEGDLSTVWDDPSTPHREQPHVLTDAQVTATLAAIHMIVERVEINGGAVRALVSHRQSSATRRNDPGSAVWQRIALPASAAHGLSDGGPGFAIGDGRPNPREWDPSRTERY